MTQVKFLIEKVGNDVFAYFPRLNYNKFIYDNGLKTSYSHIGQHSGCNPDYAKECKPASKEQYNDLLKELIGQGYNDLKVLNK